MRGVGGAKTVWALKSARRLVFLTSTLILVVTLFSVVVYHMEHVATSRRPAVDGYNVALLRVGGQNFTLDIAAQPDKQELGLSKRASLGKDRGMLFSFDNIAGQRCIWMKDMQFPIDVVWLDGTNKYIIQIASTVNPGTYPKAFCTTQPTGDFVELPAGTAQRLMLHNDMALDIQRL